MGLRKGQRSIQVSDLSIRHLKTFSIQGTVFTFNCSTEHIWFLWVSQSSDMVVLPKTHTEYIYSMFCTLQWTVGHGGQILSQGSLPTNTDLFTEELLGPLNTAGKSLPWSIAVAYYFQEGEKYGTLHFLRNCCFSSLNIFLLIWFKSYPTFLPRSSRWHAWFSSLHFTLTRTLWGTLGYEAVTGPRSFLKEGCRLLTSLPPCHFLSFLATPLKSIFFVLSY